MKCDGNGTFTREEIHGGEWCEVVAGTCLGCSACMRMLSLTQPWCSLVAKGIKTIETRSFGTKFRGLIAFQATLDQGPWNQIRVDGTRRSGFYPESAKLVQPFRFAMGIETLPFGAVVAVADLVDVLPIVGGDSFIHGQKRRPGSYIADLPHEGPLPHQEGGLWIIGDNAVTHGAPTRIEDQSPFGDFTPGRFGWMLENIRRLPKPIPAKGFQGLRACPQDVAEKIAEQLA